MVVLGAYLAWVAPCQPGDLCYTAQQFATAWRVRLTAGEEAKSSLLSELVERQLTFLAQTEEGTCMATGLKSFEEALDEAHLNLEALEGEPFIQARGRLISLMVQADVVLTAVENAEDLVDCEADLGAVKAKVESYLAEIPEEEIATALLLDNTLSESLPVSFLGYAADHSVYPLEGGHEEVPCESCHVDGAYAETPVDCERCHQGGGRARADRGDRDGQAHPDRLFSG